MMIQNDGVIHCIYLFVIIKPCSIFQVFPWLSDFNQCPIDDPQAPNNPHNWLPKVTLSKDDGQWISYARAWLMHDVMNITSSHNDDFAQFHMKASQMLMLSCFMNNMKHKSLCSSPNFDGLPIFTNAYPNMIWMKIQTLKHSILQLYPQMLNLKPFISNPKTQTLICKP